jgi:hypothetical protein
MSAWLEPSEEKSQREGLFPWRVPFLTPPGITCRPRVAAFHLIPWSPEPVSFLTSPHNFLKMPRPAGGEYAHHP